MAVLGVMLLGGTTLAGWHRRATWKPWHPAGLGEPPGIKGALLSVARGLAIGVVAGVWVGFLITGPAMRLIMRLLAVTAGDSAQGVVTEADQVVGTISLDNTIGLLLFGGVLPGILSGVIFVAIRRWLPPAWKGGLLFGLLHLVVAATRIDPLRADNVDFDIVGPGWLSVSTFGLATVLHGVAVAAYANRYSRSLPLQGTRAERARALVPAIVPALMMIPGFFVLAVLSAATIVTSLAWQVRPLVRALRSKTVNVAARVALGGLALVLAPAALRDLLEIATH